jgi:hypothetical protein
MNEFTVGHGFQCDYQQDSKPRFRCMIELTPEGWIGIIYDLFQKGEDGKTLRAYHESLDNPENGKYTLELRLAYLVGRNDLAMPGYPLPWRTY